MTNRIAFQGEPGAYSHEACRNTYPEKEPLPCRTFEDAIAAVGSGEADLVMLPVENSTYGRVSDIHHLLPDSGLHIISEAFVRVKINLLALPGTSLDQIETACSHPMLLGQCRNFLSKHGIQRQTAADTAGSARQVAEKGDPKLASLASSLAAEIYGLDVLATDIEDHGHNTTRFLCMAPELDKTVRGSGDMLTTFVFQVRSIPAALYKALGGFATNGVNMTKLESYMIDGSFTATRFYADIVGHPDDAPVKRAMEELAYFASDFKIIGVYPADRPRT